MSASTMPIAFPDAVQEFRAETTGQTAERGAATSVSIATRSGTNDFHGGIFEFFRNDGFGSAREYFSPIKSPYKRNQFGGGHWADQSSATAVFLRGLPGHDNTPELAEHNHRAHGGCNGRRLDHICVGWMQRRRGQDIAGRHGQQPGKRGGGLFGKPNLSHVLHGTG